MNTVIYVKVAIIIADGADPNEVVEDMDYSFSHPAIIETEIRDVDVLVDD